jgi:hypothetical protein
MAAIITLPTEAILAKLGPNGEHWVKGAWESGDKMCMHQGIRVCMPQSGDPYLAEQVGKHCGWGTDFNDADPTVWADIPAALRAHQEITEVELEATFGPNWALIRTVVNQAAALTEDQAKRLAAARDAAWAAARDAARDAAWAAAWAAARDAARDAAWAAARDAALAVPVRDLIGQHGLTQEHYELLTGPWRAVFPGFDSEAQ